MYSLQISSGVEGDSSIFREDFIGSRREKSVWRSSTFSIWSLALREEPRLRVFESRVLRKIAGPKRER